MLVATLFDLGEFGFIAQVACLAGAPPPNVVTGIGDDCAIVEVGRPEKLLVSMDAAVEGQHFYLDWLTPYEVGQRAAAAALSDIAAMGGSAFAALCSVALPPSMSAEAATELMRGVCEGLRRYGAPLIGGDTVAADALALDLCVLGWARNPWRRSGARVGDTLVVTGPLGEAAAALELVLQDAGAIRRPEHQPLLQRLASPTPRLQEAAILARSPAVHAAVDISDGLYLDARHIAECSHVRLVLELARLPISPIAQDVIGQLGPHPPWWPATSGEEYELLLAVAPGGLGALSHQLRAAGLRPLTEVGHVVPGSGVVLVHPDGSEVEMESGGWDHFRPTH
jgi:thiamine-monophosphate kinase